MWQTKAVLWTRFFVCSAPPPPPQPSPAQQLLWILWIAETGRPVFPPSDDDINIMLAAVLKGLLGIDAEELDGLLKDLPLPELGAKGGISVKQAAEVCFICYIVCDIICYITCYGYAAWPFAQDGQGSARFFILRCGLIYQGIYQCNMSCYVTLCY